MSINKLLIVLAIAFAGFLSLPAGAGAAVVAPPAGGVVGGVGVGDIGVGIAIAGVGIGLGLILIGAGKGIGMIGSHAVDAIARQPEAGGRIFTSMIIVAALIEGATLFAIVVGLLGVYAA